MNPTARCWAQIDLDIIEGNYARAKAMLRPGCALIPVIKANAYGLGALPIARFLYGLGARLFAVATVSEALDIKSRVDADVLVMGLCGDDAREAISRGVVLTAYSLECALALSRAAVRTGEVCRVHFKVNTGLNRLGFSSDDPEALNEAARLPNLRVEGLFTHLGLHSRESDLNQFERFERAARVLNAPLLHALDSIGLSRYPDHQYGAVRLGAWLYGVHPMDVAADACPLAVSLRARVAQVFWARAGEYVGYDDCHTLTRDTLIATLSCGYADGYPRQRVQGWVSIGGARAPVLGLICMDQMMADVTDIDGVSPGDEAILLGGPISIDEYASWSDSNRNEALCRISRRVPRLYLSGGKIIAVGGEMLS